VSLLGATTSSILSLTQSPQSVRSVLTANSKDLPVQQLVSELGVQALAVAVLPGTARFDVERRGYLGDRARRRHAPLRRLELGQGENGNLVEHKFVAVIPVF
jgi:hypothetical protein